MAWKKKPLSACNLYLILDAGVADYDRLMAVMKQAVLCGVDIVQLRDKLGDAKDILRFSKKAMAWLKGRVPFIVNDRVDLAFIAGAGGVHLGQDDIPVKQARKILGPRALIGVSCQTMSHVIRAREQGADYVGFGSVFKTLTKPERSSMDLRKLAVVARYVERNRYPLFAIGGIAQNNVAQVQAAGIQRIAVCRDVLLAKDPRKSVMVLKAALAGNIKL